MQGFFRRSTRLERRLEAARPRPGDELVRSIEAQVEAARPLRTRRSSFRIAVPVALTATMVGALAAVGGVGYAASSVEHAATAVTKVFAPARSHQAIVVAGLTAGGDQYTPGFAWGDPADNHPGPPGITAVGGNGAFAPPLTAKTTGATSTISTSFKLDDQARLFVSVVDPTTKQKIDIVQKGSKIGTALKGTPAKTINYQVLVPRTIPLKLTIPTKLLTPGVTYQITIIARDPEGNKKTLTIPFTA